MTSIQELVEQVSRNNGLTDVKVIKTITDIIQELTNNDEFINSIKNKIEEEQAIDDSLRF